MRLRMAAERPPDLIIFDASSFRSNGLRNCRRLHRQHPHVPLIHIRTAETEIEADIADFFLLYPLTSRKLFTQVRDCLPTHEMPERTVQCGPFTLYLSRRVVEIEGRGEQKLTRKLAELLEEFLRHPNEILGRKQLMENVWQTSYVGDTRTLDVHIRWIREIIEPDPKQPVLLVTLRGMGYMLQLP
jgi:DNA-binding response OmpR family regulator